MEFDEESKGREKIEGAHNSIADFADSSYATEEEEEKKEGAEREEEREYSKRAAAFLASWGFFPHIDNQLQGSLETVRANFPVRSPPPPDVKLSVISSCITQPVLTSSKEKGSFFSLSSFYDASDTGRARHMKIIEVALRMAAAVFSLIAFCVMSSTWEMRVAAGSTFEVKFSDFQAYNYLVALNVVSFVYSSAQVVVILQSSNGSGSGGGSVSSIFASPLRLAICKYFCDEILAFCLFSASSSAATALELSHYGLHNIWPPACSTWKLWMFCSKADAAVVISFFSSVAVIMSSLLSGFYLLHAIALL